MTNDLYAKEHPDIVDPGFTLIQKAFDANDNVTELLECLWPKIDQIDYLCTKAFKNSESSNDTVLLARRILDILNGEEAPSMHDDAIEFTMDDDGIHLVD